ncbi:MAG: c-type cytochrome [Polaromonas sp.]
MLWQPPRGKIIFNAAGTCATCHAGIEFTDANTLLHPASDAVSEPEPNGAPSYASRSATKQYRTAPLKGLWQHARPISTTAVRLRLDAVVRIYNTKRSLGLKANEITDLTEYLKSL